MVDFISEMTVNVGWMLLLRSLLRAMNVSMQDGVRNFFYYFENVQIELPW